MYDLVQFESEGVACTWDSMACESISIRMLED